MTMSGANDSRSGNGSGQVRGSIGTPNPVSDADDSSGASPRHADFSRAVLEDLYRYPRKRVGTAFTLWALTGFFGGHRFYLDRPGTGLLMLLTAGGGLIWWIVDAFYVRRMVAAFNDAQAQRERTAQPPMALDFMPPARGATLPQQPAWFARRSGRARLAGDLLVLSLAGFSLGSASAGSGNYEAVIAVLAISAITLLGARWDALATIPVLSGLDRWSHRLRLFYYTTDPGGPIELFFRPIIGLLAAPFRRRARAEAWLYLQLGGWFTIGFTGLDLVQAVGIGANGIDLHPADFFLDMAFTFVAIYAFATPIGAILTTHVLLEKSDLVVWMLTGVALVALLLGMSVVP
jgi:TM2 domain-containing membrane protein YozV